MSPEEKLWNRVKILMKERGSKALEISKQSVLKEKIEYGPLREALRYFMEECWFDFLHPTLISLGCESVGGNHEETIKMGAGIALIAGAADIHDDIIDQSTIKETAPTVFGKFGRDIAVLSGDVLLLKGLYVLNEACVVLPRNKSREILEAVKRTFFEMSSAEAREASLRGRTDISRRDYLDIINHKVAAGETTMRIGAILGNGTEKEIALMAHYGRTLGILLATRDEFVDIFEPTELKNRVEKECLPLPILLALQDDSRKSSILQLLEQPITEDKIERILDLSIDNEETKDLTNQMRSMVEEEILNLSTVKKCKETLELLLRATVEDL